VHGNIESTWFNRQYT